MKVDIKSAHLIKCSGETPRLNGIRFDYDAACIVATNGKILVKVPVELEEGDQTATISKECWDFAVGLAKKSKHKWIQIKVNAETCTTCNGVVFESANTHSKSVVEYPTNYVDWKAVYTEVAEITYTYTFAINPSLLMDIAKATGSDVLKLAFNVNAENKVGRALLVSPNPSKHSTAVVGSSALIMPCY